MAQDRLTSEEKIQRVFNHSFAKAELAYLERRREFVQAKGRIQTLKDIARVVELGTKLLRDAKDTTPISAQN